MIGGVVRFGLRNQGGKLRDARHAQQQHDKQCFPVAVEVAHYGNGQTVYKRDPQHLGYQNEAASCWMGQSSTVSPDHGILSDGVSMVKHLSAVGWEM